MGVLVLYYFRDTRLLFAKAWAMVIANENASNVTAATMKARMPHKHDETRRFDLVLLTQPFSFGLIFHVGART